MPKSLPNPECANFKKSEWGTDQVWGVLTIRYKPTGELKKIKLGIKRMGYHNELIFCDAWGYDRGSPTDLNHPDNYEVVSIEPNSLHNKHSTNSEKGRMKKEIIILDETKDIRMQYLATIILGGVPYFTNTKELLKYLKKNKRSKGE